MAERNPSENFSEESDCHHEARVLDVLKVLPKTFKRLRYELIKTEGYQTYSCNHGAGTPPPQLLESGDDVKQAEI